MKLRLDYGRDGLWVDIPDRNLRGVLQLSPLEPIQDPAGAVADGLCAPIACPPLGQLAMGRSSACVVISDITRPVPNRLILPPILRVLKESGIDRCHTTILVATGLHRASTDQELDSMVGPDIVRDYRIVSHSARAQGEVTYLGQTSIDLPIWVNSTYLASELKVATALIEPHLMAGYSGGRKAICPGIAGVETIRRFHGYSLLSSPSASEGVIDGNPVHQQSLEVARAAGVDFIVNVAMDQERRVTGVFCGDLERAHEAGVRHTRRQAEAFVPAPVDVVLTTGAGYPLDLTFYQAIKGLTAALPIVKEGGTIILAAQCAEGLGGEEFSELLGRLTGPDEFRALGERTDSFAIDQWQIQELCKVLNKASVILHSDSTVPDRFVSAARSVEDGIEMALGRHGRDASMAVIPKGPYVLSRVADA